MNEANCACSRWGGGVLRSRLYRRCLGGIFGAEVGIALTSCRDRKGGSRVEWKKSWRFLSALEKRVEVADVGVAGCWPALRPRVEIRADHAPPALCRDEKQAGRRCQSRFAASRVMVPQIVRRIIGGADVSDVEFFENALGGEFRCGELVVGTFSKCGPRSLRRGIRRCRSSVSVPDASNDRADCAAYEARLRPRP